MTKISIIEEKEIPLLNRKNITLKLELQGKTTPSKIDTKKEVVAFLKTDEKKVIIKNINQQFGGNTALIKVRLYKDEKSLKEMEEINKKKKKAKGEKESGKESEAKK